MTILVLICYSYRIIKPNLKKFIKQPTSYRRLIGNEAFFRQHNEQVKKQLDQIIVIATEENQQSRIPDESSTIFQFYCECSDENCLQRIAIPLDTYTKIHQQRHNFIIKPGHDVIEVEKIIKKESTFWIVEKRVNVPEEVNHLSVTSINNT